jgi:hypothetical protein
MRYILICLMCTACACKPVVIPGPETKQYIEVDARLMAVCAPLPTIASNTVSASELLAHKAEEVKVYSECASRHKELSDIIRKYWKVPK